MNRGVFVMCEKKREMGAIPTPMSIVTGKRTKY